MTEHPPAPARPSTPPAAPSTSPSTPLGAPAPAPDPRDFRAAVLRGFAAGRARALSYGLTAAVGGLALGLGPRLSGDPELARAGWVGLAALYGLAGALGLSGLGLIALGWTLPRARADQLLGLLTAQPCTVVEVGRLGLRDRRAVPVDADDPGPQQLYLRTARGLRLRVPMAADDLSLALRFARAAAPTAVIHGLD